MQLTFEISIDSVLSAKNAQEAGANRVELCANLLEGGTTPSIGMIKTVRKNIDLQMFVIIRPRGGDFLYTREEFEVICNDILEAKRNGADGIVSGALTTSGAIDIEKTAKMIELAYPLPFTFHRAFDMCKDPFEALAQLKKLKVSRILTSGQKKTAEEGIPLLKELVKKADNNITIMPGAGININNIEQLISETGAKEFHFSGKKKYTSGMKYFNKNISMGNSNDIDEFSIFVSDKEIIKAVISKAEKYLKTIN